MMNGTGYGTDAQGALSNTLAAVFATERDARDGIKELHKAGFKRTWLGVAKQADRKSGEPLVEDKQGLGALFFPDQTTLRKALLDTGVSAWQADEVTSRVAPGCAVLTVYAEDNPQRAAELLEMAKGDLVVNEAEFPDAARIASMSPRTGVERDDRGVVEPPLGRHG
jgi:hypothetical protein